MGLPSAAAPEQPVARFASPIFSTTKKGAELKKSIADIKSHRV